jgi:hypothetical protein
LLKKVDWYSNDGRIAYSALGQKYFSTFGTQLRADLADNFATLYRKSSDRMVEQFGTTGQNQVDNYKRENLNDFIRNQFVKAAIGALAQHGSADDRSLIEPLLGSADSEIAPLIAELPNSWGDTEKVQT